MKSITAIILIFVTSIPCYAQNKWTAGYRTGLEIINLNINPHSDFKSNNLIWTNELFVDHKLGKRFEIEAGIRYGRKTYIDTGTVYDAPEFMVAERQQVNQITLLVNIKYHFIITQKYSLYCQAGTSAMRRIATLLTRYYNPNEVIKEYYSSTYSNTEWFNTFSTGAGINYNLYPRLQLNATLTADYNTYGRYYMATSSYNDWSAHLLIGIGYKL